MFTACMPEQAGLDTKYIRRFMARLDRHAVNLHSVLMARGNAIFFEKYVSPFTKDTPHRMYSITKSYAGLAIGLLADEGKLSLDDPLISFFPDRVPGDVDPLLKEQTIRHMLRMQTCFGSQIGTISQRSAVYHIRLYFIENILQSIYGRLLVRL